MADKEYVNDIKIEPRICKIPVYRNECEDLKQKCCNCKYRDNCDYNWVFNLWAAENKKFGKNSLLGPANPMTLKPDFRNGHVLTMTGKYDFCCFNVPKTKDTVTIGDIYVDDAARGMGISRKIIEYLMTTYDRDIFAKCVRGSSAEAFWQHIGKQIDANSGDAAEHDMYQHRPNKRDLGWYIVENKNKKYVKEDLF